LVLVGLQILSLVLIAAIAVHLSGLAGRAVDYAAEAEDTAREARMAADAARAAAVNAADLADEAACEARRAGIDPVLKPVSVSCRQWSDIQRGGAR
jgi:hypothetical protein